MGWHPDMPDEYKNQIITGDARELAGRIPDESIDLIFTDPPYAKEFLQLYFEIFAVASRILRKDGFLLMYVGGYWKDDIMARAREHLSFFWDYIVWEPFNSPVNWPRKTICRNKSILAYIPKEGKSLPTTQVLSVWLGGGEDKRFHVWGQDESEARYFISCFSRENKTILDLCAGGGTIPAMAKKLGRDFVAFEIDHEAAEIARERVRNTQPPLFVTELEQLELTEQT